MLQVGNDDAGLDLAKKGHELGCREILFAHQDSNRSLPSVTLHCPT
jgi:hypothetical protein